MGDELPKEVVHRGKGPCAPFFMSSPRRMRGARVSPTLTVVASKAGPRKGGGGASNPLPPPPVDPVHVLVATLRLLSLAEA